MKRSLATVATLLALAGCGGDDDAAPRDAGAPAPATVDTYPERTNAPTEAAPDEPSPEEQAQRPPGEDGLRVAAQRARIVVQESRFGRVLFDANGQVVYVFENDGPNESNCTSADCVTAWPPVLTQDDPTAGPGVDASLLGTIRRADGALQVTYADRPLYFYEHEQPGEIRCHNVNLHGGLWWVVTPAGRPAT